MPYLYWKSTFFLTDGYAQRPAWILSPLFHYGLIIAVLKLPFENTATYIQLQISQVSCFVKNLPLHEHWHMCFENVSLVFKSVIYLTRFGIRYARATVRPRAESQSNLSFPSLKESCSQLLHQAELQLQQTCLWLCSKAPPSYSSGQCLTGAHRFLLVPVWTIETFLWSTPLDRVIL